MSRANHDIKASRVLPIGWHQYSYYRFGFFFSIRFAFAMVGYIAIGMSKFKINLYTSTRIRVFAKYKATYLISGPWPGFYSRMGKIRTIPQLSFVFSNIYCSSSFLLCFSRHFSPLTLPERSWLHLCWIHYALFGIERVPGTIISHI